MIKTGNPTRCALYIRVSTDEQKRKGYSLEAQKNSLLKFAKKYNYKVVGIYTDEAVSARKSYKHRKSFMRLIDDVRRKKIDLILFIKLDRWFRNISDYYKIQEILDNNKVNWKATHENYDTTTASGRLNINIRLAIAQDECDRTSERIRFVFDKRIDEGRVITGATPYGYKIVDKRLVIKKDEVDYVCDAFNEYLRVHSKRSTYNYLTEKYGYQMSLSNFTNLLSNSKYIGCYRGNNNYCEPIIDEKIFYKVQELLKKRSQMSKLGFTGNRYNYIFSGLIRCSICNSKCCGTGFKKGDKEYRYYICRNTMDKLCHGKRIREEKIEEYLLSIIENMKEHYKTYSGQKPRGLRLLNGSNTRDKYSKLSNTQKKAMWQSLIKDILIDENGMIEVIYHDNN